MKKAMTLIALVLVLALLCCGCGEPTPEEVAENMEAAMLETPCSQMEMLMNFDMTMAAEGMSLDMEIAMDMIATICEDPMGMYMCMDIGMGFMGQEMEIAAESYTLLEDGKPVNYTCYDGAWTRTEADESMDSLLDTDLSVDLTDAATLAIDDTVTEWEGREAICLTAQVTGDSVEDVLGTMMEGMEDSVTAMMGEMDWSALSCDVRIYVDPETYLPMAEELTITGMDTAFSSALDELGMTLEITDLSATVVYTSYEPQDPIELPEDAVEYLAALERAMSGDPDNGDGTYTIHEGDVLMNIATPAGMTVTGMDYDHVDFADENGVCRISYQMWYLEGDDDMSGVNFQADVSDAVERYTAAGGTVEREQVEKMTDELYYLCDMVNVTWESGRTDVCYTCWAPVYYDETGTYYLLVVVEDGLNNGLGLNESADITLTEFEEYLNCATYSTLMTMLAY